MAVVPDTDAARDRPRHDNIIFLSILVSRLPAADQPRARVLGLGFAMLTRIALLFSITWLIRLRAPLFTVLAHWPRRS